MGQLEDGGSDSGGEQDHRARDDEPRSPAPSHGRLPPLGARRCRERLVMVEDRLLERAKLLTRLDPELLVERAADILVGGESVCLTAAAVEREHLVGAQPLLQRVAGDEQLQLRDEIGLAADSEIGVDPLLEQREVQLLQPRYLGLDEVVVGHVRERMATPYAERLAQQRARLRRLGLTRLRTQDLDPVDV